MKKVNNKKQIDAEINRVLLNDFDKIENFVVTRWKQMFIGAGVIIVLVAIAYGILLKKENNAAAARRAIADASTKEELSQVIERYKSYSEVDFARIKLARICVEAKDFAKAGELYRAVALNTQSQDLKCRMLLDEAYMIEKAGDFDKACKAFVVIADNSMYAAGVRAEAYYSAGRLFLKAGKKDDAAKVFDKLNQLASDETAAVWCNLGKALQAK